MDISTLLDPFSILHLPLADMANDFIRWLTSNFRDVFRAMKVPVKILLDLIEDGLRGAPQTLIVLLIGLLGWQVVNRATGLLAFFAMTTIGLIGAWDAAMTSLSVLTSAVLLATMAGLPVGILCSRSNLMWAIVRPILDFMQTVPSFTYLVPVILLFGIGNVPGVIVTAFFATPPLIRLTNLALRSVREDLVEAGNAFGASPWKLLWAIEMPLARPTIMAGLNQTVMLSLAMSVIASMISVAGLGRLVLVGISQLDMARAATGGVGIVLLAMVFDRITQGFGLTRRDRNGHSLWEQGPVGHLRALFSTSQKTQDIPTEEETL
ncbi:ABC transporter permease [Cochlodiniinecator piscidefendens]|uniref:ABC transporter permease n=1 Tax=Cochlodiniinecator piscidefendens TaxID=2715756 RepID=UPI00140A7F21|nr:ABC transporter permease subunit [Cochlodiniinecator piscidefendens]